jgi:hypothetical protein
MFPGAFGDSAGGFSRDPETPNKNGGLL